MSSSFPLSWNNCACVCGKSPRAPRRYARTCRNVHFACRSRDGYGAGALIAEKRAKLSAFLSASFLSIPTAHLLESPAARPSTCLPLSPLPSPCLHCHRPSVKIKLSLACQQSNFRFPSLTACKHLKEANDYGYVSNFVQASVQQDLTRNNNWPKGCYQI